MLRNGKRILLIAFSALGICLVASQASLGAGRETIIQKNRKEHQHLFDVIKDIKNQNKQLGAVVQELDQRAGKKQGEIQDIQKQLKDAKAKQLKMEDERQQRQSELTTYQLQLSKRAREIYVEGDLSYVDLLFQSSSVSDFIDRMFFVQAMLDQDHNLIGKTRSAQTQLKSLLVALDQQIASINQIKTKLDTQLADLQAIRSDKKDLISANDNDIELYQKKAAELEDENKRLEAIARIGSGYSGKWGGSFMKPVPGPIMSPFGWRVHPIFHTRKLHTGVDIGASEGTPIHPGAKGKVIFADWMKGYGNCVMVDHGGGISTLYGHMSAIKCSVGDIVTTDSVIGKVGMTGYATGPHLHFEKRVNGKPVDPLSSIKGAGPVNKSGDNDE